MSPKRQKESAAAAKDILLKDRIQELETAIRQHRDAKGDDRCWLDDQELYKVLGEQSADFALPSKEEFLANCARYHASRQPPGTIALKGSIQGRWVTKAEQLAATDISVLSKTELMDVFDLSDSPHIPVAIAGMVDRIRGVIYLILNTPEIIEVAISQFQPSGTETPDFTKFRVIDHGTAIALGNFEVGMDTILCMLGRDPRSK